MDLLDLVQNIRALLFEKWATAFAIFDRGEEIDFPRNVRQLADDAQR